MKINIGGFVMYRQCIKVTDKFLIHNFKYVIQANPILSSVFKYISPSYYNFNNDGWKYDAYVLKDDVVVVMGRKPIGKIEASHEFCKKYVQQTRKIESNAKRSEDEEKELEFLIDTMLIELLGKNYESAGSVIK